MYKNAQKPCGHIKELSTEGTYFLHFRAEEARRDQKLGVIMIIDMKGFSYDVLFHIPATRIYINMLLLIQVIFLGRIQHNFDLKLA